MLRQSVLDVAQPYLKGRTVRDAVIGISLLAVELDNGSVGVSYVLREDLNAGCSIFPFGQHVVGQDACAIAEWALIGGDSLQKGIGVAVLGAASQAQDLRDMEAPGRPLGIAVRDSDTVGMIGLVAPVAKMMRPRCKELYVFDKGISECGGGDQQVFSVESQSRLLPACDIVILSGTTMINGSIDELLGMCVRAREIVMLGASTPMYPAAFHDTGITVLAGSWWVNSQKNEIFRRISLACGISDLSAYAIKKSVGVLEGPDLARR